MKLDQIARTCHEAHNQICKNNGQETIAWEDKSEAHHKTVKNSIKKILNGIIGSPEEAHMNFKFKKRKDGWTYGENYSTRARTNPRLCDFEELPEAERQKEEMFFAIARSFKKD